MKESEDALYAYNDWKRDDEFAAEELRERAAEGKPDTERATVQTAKKPLSDFSDIGEREAAYRKKHNLADDAIIFTDELYTREEMESVAVAELKRCAHTPNDEALPRRGAPLAAARGSTSEKRVKQKK